MNGIRAFVRAIRGPIMLITLGSLFALDHFGDYSFSRTFPVLLIMFGLMKLAEHLAGSAGQETTGGGGL
ncbi:MAG: DUF5668 domain-containing protein [Acidobacteriota bacterium]